MKKSLLYLVILLTGTIPPAAGQSGFSKEEYARFLENNMQITASSVQEVHPVGTYYNDRSINADLSRYRYLDSLDMHFHFTPGEKTLLEQHEFMVSERLSYDAINQPLQEIYINDFPVFLSTDLVLHALHVSYDNILLDLERNLMEPNLLESLEKLYKATPAFIAQYNTNPHLQDALSDLDLYVTIAYSLSRGKIQEAQYTEQKVIEEIWDAIQAEKHISIPLFSDRNRRIDFSQFTVRGHYTQVFYTPQGRRTLGDYFKTMMWLGRIDFMCTPPPGNPWEEPWTREEIRRMNLGAYLLQKLIDASGIRTTLEENDKIIRFLVGDSDNLTMEEYDGILNVSGINEVTDLLDDERYDVYYEKLITSSEAAQKILSAFLLMDPFSSEPGTLPVSYRVMGQRFIIDSHVFANVVFDRIIHQGEKVWRPMPDPLDAMFVLGNNDALPLLNDELEEYHYAPQLNALRYLVDAYDEEFWTSSLYNAWLQALRELNVHGTDMPWFMKTTAWHQQKLNTQLASWTQLRHDNLLYAKQSYTGGTGCSFPHAYIEPYPGFYQSIADYAGQAAEYFSMFEYYSGSGRNAAGYFTGMQEIMLKLKNIAEKELAGIPISKEEDTWLKEMLYLDAMSGAPPFSGWISDLFYDPHKTIEKDFLVADVHTQPTEYNGAEVGKVFHVGTGKFNLGVFLAGAPNDHYKPTAFVGPVMSYYEHITRNWKRLTDEEWSDKVDAGDLPPRPEWTKIYLADEEGNIHKDAVELPGVLYQSSANDPVVTPQESEFYVYPNPVHSVAEFRCALSCSGQATLTIVDPAGRTVELIRPDANTADIVITWDRGGLSPGVYLAVLHTANEKHILKFVLE